MKQVIIRDLLASGAASEIFFFDADVLVLDDPWSGAAAGAYDVKYQIEHVGSWADRHLRCNRPLNSGQLLLRSTAAALRAFEIMVSLKETILGGQKLDQDYLLAALKMAGARACHLDPQRFVGACRHHRVRSAPERNFITFHGTCLGSEDEKLRVLRNYLERAKAR